MKKYLIVFTLIVSLLLVLCACKSNQEDADNPVSDSSATSGDITEPVEKETIDWETPIDVDDSFVQDSTDPTEAVTEPAETEVPTKPQTSNPTEPAVNPTDAPDVTEAPVSDPTETTEPPVQVPTKPSGSGPIELPMIPG